MEGFYENTYLRLISFIIIIVMFISIINVYAYGDETIEEYPLSEEDLIEAGIDIIYKKDEMNGNPIIRSMYPLRVDLSDSDYFPPIFLQPGGSCVASAITYYQYTYEACKLNNLDASLATNQYSPSFTYNIVNRNDDGTGTELVYAVLKDHGCLDVVEFPINYGNFIEWSPSIYAQRNALKTRLTNVGIAYVDGTVSSNSSSELDEIKEYLASDRMLLNVIGWFDWIIKETEDGDYAVVRSQITQRIDEYTGWHGMTIVGYDDSIECDINGDGIIEDAESGALILANSHGAGFGNDGFIYIMYDALNLVSEVKDKDDNSKTWDYEETGTRLKVFGDSSEKAQQFRAAYVNNYNPVIIAEVGMQTNARSEVGFSYLQRNLSTNIVNGKNSKDGIFTSAVAAAYPFNSTVLFDVSSVCTGVKYRSRIRETFEKTYRIEFTITDDTFTTTDYFGDTDGVTGITFKLTDIDGNTIQHIEGYSGVLEENSHTFTSDNICGIGDVNYDGILSVRDALIIQQYINNSIDFNKTQKILADYNNDGIINEVDTTEIINAVNNN